MNRFRYSLFLIAFLCALTLQTLSQNNAKTVVTPPKPIPEKKSFDLLNDNIRDFLPPLEALIDTALKYDGYVNFRRKQIDVNTFKLKTDSRQFYQNIGFEADARYGDYDNWSTNVAEGLSPSVFSTTRSEMRYGAGAYIKFPIFDIIDHKNKKDMAKMEIGQAQEMYKLQCDELRQKLVSQYNDVILKQKLLVIRSKFWETSRVNMLMAEKEFLNGVLPVSEYSRLSSIVYKAEEDYEQAKSEFQTAYMLLEEYAHMKLNIFNPNQ